MGHETKTEHIGVKNAVICHILLSGQKTVSRGEIYLNGFFQGRLHRFWSSKRNMSTLLRRVPSYEQIIAFYLNSSGGKTRKNAGITSHEFVTLVGVLTERAEAHAAIIQSGQTRTRIEQQRRHDRDSSWESIVASSHNDKTVINCFTSIVGSSIDRYVQSTLSISSVAISNKCYGLKI